MQSLTSLKLLVKPFETSLDGQEQKPLSGLPISNSSIVLIDMIIDQLNLSTANKSAVKITLQVHVQNVNESEYREMFGILDFQVASGIKHVSYFRKHDASLMQLC